MVVVYRVALEIFSASEVLLVGRKDLIVTGLLVIELVIILPAVSICNISWYGAVLVTLLPMYFSKL